MKIWGLGLLFVLSGVFGQEESVEEPRNNGQWADGREVFFPDWLQAQKDIFLRRAIFDFGQAFFRIRGLDSRYTEQRFNGFPMNSLFDGRPEWQQWAGLNDITRDEAYALGIQLFEEGPGGLQGGRALTVRPSLLPNGTRITVSETNRQYRHRGLVTSTGSLGKKWEYGVSASLRWAREGIVQGSPYQASAAYVGLEWKAGTYSRWLFTGIWNSNNRMRLPAMTQEVFAIKGPRYNPWWGLWGDKKRVSNTRSFRSPLAGIQYMLSSKKISLATGLQYQDMRSSRDRMGYFNAPNPDPTYYRYLPSYYINSPLGADFLGAASAREAFIQNGQIHWEDMIAANTNPLNGGGASYILHGDHRDTRRWTGIFRAEAYLNPNNTLRIGGQWTREDHALYARISDLLGADYHKDMDPFTDTLNDIDGEINKTNGAIFKYHYTLAAEQQALWAQWEYKRKYGRFFLSGNGGRYQVQRIGHLRNGRYPKESLGESDVLFFEQVGIKSGIEIQPSGRHRVTFNGFYASLPPVARQVFVNPRENHKSVAGIGNEVHQGWECNYVLRLARFSGRITAFQSRIRERTRINFFYVDSGLGSAFVQEVASGLDQLHQGAEFGFTYQVSSGLELNCAGSVGTYTYDSNPDIRIYFDPAEIPKHGETINTSVNLGPSEIKGYHLGQGPGIAMAVGLTYNDPAYWWMGLSMNYFDERYIRPAFIPRTASFLLDPDTGMPFPDARPERTRHLLKQPGLPFVYLLNMIGGKSWKIRDRYLSLFLSCSNVFNRSFTTGGFEQSRNGNYGQMVQDRLSRQPTFGPKVWYNSGRSFFINLSLRL